MKRVKHKTNPLAVLARRSQAPVVKDEEGFNRVREAVALIRLRLQGGTASRQDMADLKDTINVCYKLCWGGLGEEHEQIVDLSAQLVKTIEARYTRDRKYHANRGELLVLDELLDLHYQQLELATVGEIINATGG